MNYHIYLDGEECGQLTAAEFAELRKAARSDIRTWGAFMAAQIGVAWRLVSLVAQLFGTIGGIGFIAAMAFAPDILASLNGYSAAEVADALKHGALILTMLCIVAAGVVLAWAPHILRPHDVFDDEFTRRLRKLKGIRRYGQLEVIGVAPAQSQGEQ